MRLVFAGLMILGVLAFAVGLAGMIAGPLVMGGIRARAVLADGMPAEARVLDLKTTGTLINYQPLIAITIEVMPAGRPPYQAEIRKVLTAANAAAYQRGRMLRVKYDPAHPERVALVGPGR